MDAGFAAGLRPGLVDGHPALTGVPSTNACTYPRTLAAQIGGRMKIFLVKGATFS
jgi:hypothetical protein